MKLINLKEKNNMKQFEELFTPIYEEFYRFIYRITRNKFISEDVIQTSTIIAIEKYDQLKDKSKFKSWLFTIGKRQAIVVLKQYHRQVSYDDITNEFTITKSSCLPENILLKKETEIYIKEIIMNLKNEYKEIIILRYYNDLSFQDIAEILGINYTTARTRHKRAKEILSKKLINKYEGGSYEKK